MTLSILTSQAIKSGTVVPWNTWILTGLVMIRFGATGGRVDLTNMWIGRMGMD